MSFRKLLDASKQKYKSHVTNEVEAAGSTISQEEFPVGLKTLYAPQHPTIDIVFIHGLNGNRDKTWTAPGKNVPWPKLLLPEKIPTARVLTFGYNVRIVKWRGSLSNSRVGEHAHSLLHHLARHRNEDSSNNRPILFVCHSLGGIVCQDALVLANQSPEAHLKSIHDSTRGIAFLGTPLNGAGLAVWAERLSHVLGPFKRTNIDIAKVLKPDSEVLERIQESFHGMIQHRNTEGSAPILISCFYEQRAMPKINEVIVPKQSATLPMYSAFGIDASHSDMTKFATNEDPGFKDLCGELHRWTLSAASSQPPNHHQTYQVSVEQQQQEIVVDNLAKPKTIIHVPFAQNKRFVGREKESNELRQRLFQMEEERVALVGLGGMGKTSIALDLAYWVKKHMKDYSIVWLPAVNLVSFQQACRELVEELPVQLNSDDDARDVFRRYFSSENAGPWLLIIDNADDSDVMYGGSSESERKETIYSYIPQSSKGRTLMTTRVREVAVDFAKTEVIEIALLSPEYALELLRVSLSSKTQVDDPVVNELLDKLNNIPLAITQAANYINTNEISVAKYFQYLCNTDADMVKLLSRSIRDDALYNKSQTAVATTWLISFEHIRTTNASTTTLLSFISWIEPKGIPRSMLPSVGSELDFEEALGTLRGYGFLESHDEQDTLYMHSLVHLMTQVWVKKQAERLAAREDFLSHMAEVFPDDEWENRAQWREYMPHALRLFHQLKDADARSASKLARWIGRCLKMDGQIRNAVAVLKEAVAIAELFPQDDPDRLHSQHSLATAYLNNGQISDAINLLQQVVEIEQRILPEDHPSRLTSQHQLAAAYLDNGQISDAINLLKQVVEIKQKVLPEDHPSRLASQHALAYAYNKGGRISDAIDILRHVVQTEEALSQDNPNRIDSQVLLGSLYRRNGQILAAIDLLRLPVEGGRSLEKNHPTYVWARRELAITYLDDEQNLAAVNLLQHVAEQAESLAEDNTNRLLTQYLLGRAYLANDQASSAINLLQHVTEQEASLAEDDPDRLLTLIALGNAYIQNGEPRRALPLLQHVVEIAGRTLPENNKRVRGWAEQSLQKCHDAISSG